MTYLIIHGPNLNRLGHRDPTQYGSLSLAAINTRIQEWANNASVTVTIIQHNSESDIINALHEADDEVAGVVINPAGYTHTSVSIRDAIESLSIPVVEVHLSNIHRREPFRHVSYTAPVCVGQLAGFGWRGYIMALDYLVSCDASSNS